MKKEEIGQKLQEIGSCQTIEEARTKLSDLQKEFEADYTKHEGVVSERDKLSQDVKGLRESNMELYLQVSKGTKKTDPGKNPEPEGKELTYDNLFNEKGELK